MKNSALNMAGNSDVSTPVMDNNPIEIKPTTGSPRITEAIVALFSHQGRSRTSPGTTLICKLQR